MWGHDKNRARARSEKGKSDLLSSLTQSAILAFSAASEEYLEWVKRHSNRLIKRKIHGQEFCLHEIEIMNHPCMDVNEIELETTGEINPEGQIVPSASNEEDFPTVKIKISLKSKDKSQAMHKIGTEINKINMGKGPEPTQ